MHRNHSARPTASKQQGLSRRQAWVQRALLVFSLWAGATSAAEADILRLEDGRVLLGEVSDPDEDGFTFRRYDNGGTFRLSWEDLNPLDAKRLRVDFGFENLASERVMVDAIRVTMSDGRQFLCHTLDKSDSQRWYSQTYDDAREPIAAFRVRRSEDVRVPANEVYTLDQIYQAKVAELGAVLDADKIENLRLARLLETVLDYDNAKKHYEKVVELDPTYAEREIKMALARLPEKMKLRDQDLKLAEVAQATRRQRFDDAFALCDEFLVKWPASPKRSELDRRRKLAESSRASWARIRTTYHWYRAAKDLCHEAAKDKKLSLDGALDFALGQLSEQILQKVTEELREEKGGAAWAKITPDDVRSSFASRHTERTTTRREQRVSYGEGTFVLGKSSAAKGITKIEGRLQREKEREARNRERQQRQRQGERGRNNRNRQDNSVQIDPDSLPQPPSEEQWWAKKADRNDKRNFLLATYAERGGDFQVIGTDFGICSRCRGTGSEILEGFTAQTRDGRRVTLDVPVTCRRCNELGFDRVVKFW